MTCIMDGDMDLGLRTYTGRRRRISSLLFE